MTTKRFDVYHSPDENRQSPDENRPSDSLGPMEKESILASASDVLYTDLSGVAVDGARLARRQFGSVCLTGCIFRRLVIQDASLWLCFFDGSSFEDCLIESTSIMDASFSCCRFLDCRFVSCELTTTSFCGAEFEHCSFSESDLHNSRFISSSLRRTQFDDCNVKGVDFTRSTHEDLKMHLTNTEDSIGWNRAE
jgi:hypothetical protein